MTSQLAEENLSFHAHDFVIAVDDNFQYVNPVFSENFDILAVDDSESTPFVIAFESKVFPLFGMMSHPEVQQLRVFGGRKDFALEGRVDNQVTDAINFSFSHMLRREA